MAAAGILWTGPVSTTVTTTGSDAAPVWSDGATLAAGSFAASTEYLLIGWAYVQIAATNNRNAVRLVQGAGPTVLTDADGRAESTSTGADTRHPHFFMHRFTQPGSTVDVKMQIGATSTADTEGDTFLMAIPVSAFGTEGVDWFWNEVTADYTTTTTATAQAAVTFTPNGTDTYAVITQAALRILSNTVTQTMKMELHDSVAGVLQNVAMEGEEITTLERYQWMLGTAVTPTAVSHTFSARFWHATTAHTVFSSRIIAFKLNRFAQFLTDIDAAIQTPATAPTWTNIATVAPTPALTGNWAVLAFFTDDPNSISTANDGLRTRLQINAAGGGLASNPGAPYGDDAPEQYGNDTTDLVPMFIGTRASLTSGAPRTINLDVSQQTSVIRVLQTSLIAFSDELAGGGGTTVTPTTTALTLSTFAPTVTATAHKIATPTTAALATAVFAPTVTASLHRLATPTTTALTTATFAPTVTATVHRLATPTTAALTTATFAPTVSATAHQTAIPTTAALALTTFAPSVLVPRLATPTTAALTLSTFAPTVSTSAGQVVTPGAAALTLSTFAPSVATSDHKIATPPVLALTTSTFAPTVTATLHRLATPPAAALTLSTFAPTVATTAHQVVTPTTATLTLTTFAPGVAGGAGLTAVPTTRALILTTFAPAVTATAHRIATPTPAALALSTFAPSVTASNHQRVVPPTAALAIVALNPAVTASDHQRVTVALATLALAGLPPSVSVVLLPSVFYGDPPVITRASTGLTTIRRAESDAPQIFEVVVVRPVIVEVER